MFCTALLTLALAYTPTQAGSDPLKPELEMRVQNLGKELRCAVCQGLSITDSPASMARAQLDKVRELVSEGRSDADIREYFVARYGEWVLLKPKAEGFGSAVWFLPPLLVLVGALWGFFYFRQNAGKQAAVARAVPASTVAAISDPSLADPYLDAIRQELSK